MTQHKICLLLTILLGGAFVQAQAESGGDSVATFRADLEQRAEQAYERILASQTEPLAKTAEEVIDRCIQAMGGRQALASLRTMTLKVDGHMISGRFGGTRHLKAPNFIWQERNQGRGLVTDGISAWLVDGDQWQAAPPGRNTWQQMFSITLDLVDYADKQVSYEFMGTRALEGSALYKLRKTLSTGKEIFVYFDVETGLLMMEEEFGDRGWMANLFFDHREVAGVLLPHMRVRVADVLETAHVGLISYTANEALADSLFIKP